MTTPPPAHDGNAETDGIDREAMTREIHRRYTGFHVNETAMGATIRIALDVFAESLRVPPADGEPGPDHCPTCGANARSDMCASRSGRDHPTRRVWGRAYVAGVRAERAYSPASTR